MSSNLSKIELKSENGNLYVQGYVSTTDPDKYNDIVSEKGQLDIANQLKKEHITMDLDHQDRSRS